MSGRGPTRVGGAAATSRASPATTSRAAPVPAPAPAPMGRYIATSGDRKGVGVGAFLLAIVTAGALVHVTVRLKGLEVAYALGRERHIATELEEQRRRLQIEIGMLKDPGRVVLIARDKLRMGPPAADAIRSLGPGQLLGGILPVVSPTTSTVEPTARPAHPRTPARRSGR